LKYQATKRSVKCAISRAQEAERKKFGEKLDGEDKKGNLFRVARQMARQFRQIRAVVGCGCVKDVECKIVVEEEKVLDTWKAYYVKLSNEE